jgi:Flp pilus assembly protein CpaB
MAEEERGSGVQNIWLLVIAIALGLVVVFIYNMHISRVRNEARGAEIRLLRLTRDIEAGQRLTDQDLETVLVNASNAKGLEGVVTEGEKLGLAIDSVVNTRLERGRYLLREHVTKGKAGTVNTLDRGNVSFVVSVDQRKTIGTLLKPGARVNLVGMLPADDGSLRAVRIIKWVRVLEVGGLGGEGGALSASGGMRSYTSVTVEVPEDLALKLSNVMTHVSGGCWVELPSSSDMPAADKLRLVPEVLKYADKAAAMKKVGST